MPAWAPEAASGATVITASEHLARNARLIVNQHLVSIGRTGWLAPDVMSLREYVIEKWLSQWPALQLASAPQELAVWSSSISASSSLGLVSAPALARSARSAARLIARHGGAPDALTREYPAVDEGAFITAWKDAQAKLATQGLATEEQALREVVQNHRDSKPPLAQPLFLLGFESATGLVRDLVDVLVGAGAQEVIEPPGEPSLIQIAATTSHEDALSLASTLIDDALRDTGDAPSICLAVPDLPSYRDRIDDALTEHITPQAATAGVGRGVKPWRYARGIPLSDHPMVSAVLTMLTLAASRSSDTAAISQCLLSPFLFPGDDLVLRASIDMELRNLGHSRVRNDTVSKLILGVFPDRSDSGIALWAAALVDDHPSCAVGEWVSRWEDLIRAIGSPVVSADDDHPTTLHIKERWDEAVAGLLAMDTTLQSVTGLEAIAWLREVMADIPVQPPVEHEQPIQVMSYNDIEGMRFDLLIVLDASSTTIPPLRKPVGFIPNAVLAGLGMPSSTAADHFDRWRAWVARLSNRASRVVAVVSHLNADGAEQQASSLLGEAKPLLVGVRQSRLRESITVCSTNVLDEPPVCAVDLYKDHLRGGASLVKNIALSPFVAFIRNRTHTQPFPDIHDGLTARDQGNMVHDALFAIWGELADSSGLKSSSQDRLLDLVTASAEHAVRRAQVRSNHGHSVASLETRRLIKICMGWLELEGRRAWDFKVLGREVVATAAIVGLPLDLKIDRIDEVMEPGGATHNLVIDYKTGSTKPSDKSWQPGSMTEPQLPIYATCVDWPMHSLALDEIHGIAFGHVIPTTRSGGPSFVTRARFGTQLVHTPKAGVGSPDPVWPHTLAFMKADLERMAGLFMGGDLGFDRKAILKSAHDKDFPPLLRRADPTVPNASAAASVTSMDAPF